MTREELTELAISKFTENKRILLEFCTGTGKSKISIEMYNTIGGKCLIVVPERAHFANWKADIAKHGFSQILPNMTFICYASIHKYIGKKYDVIILDETHHALSNRRINAIKRIEYKKTIMLTATITEKEKKLLTSNLGSIEVFKYSLSDAINSDILPQPKIHLMPLELDSFNKSQEIVISRGLKGCQKQVTCDYEDNWRKYIKMYKDINLSLKCTELEKYSYLCSQIDYYQTAYYKENSIIKYNRWMQMASERKRFIASLKTPHVKKFITTYNSRYLCFSGSIKQCDELGGKGCIIHSKISNPDKIIERFNAKKINTLFAVDMLREGMNLVEANAIIIQLDSKSRSAIQMCGRALRHDNPVIHIFYYKDTQDEVYLNNSLQEFGEFVV